MATEEIPLLPNIPERLRIAAKQGIVIPFIGAGVSQLGGCPGWDGFADDALRYFLNRKDIDHAKYDQLSRLPARVKLSVAVGLEQQFKANIEFDKILKPHDAIKKAAGEKIYAHLAQLAHTFVTTNYDEWLDIQPAAMPELSGVVSTPTTSTPSLTRNPLWNPEEFTDIALTTPGTVIHIHGSAKKRDSMILTTSDYLKRYSSHQPNDENTYLTFLGHLFRTKSVLFIGYSLSELEILEYVIQKGVGNRGIYSKQEGPLEEPMHHIVQGFYSHEAQLMRGLSDYYLNEFNVRLLPFSKDQSGWHQLIEVVEHLSRQIPVGGVLPTQQRLEMEALLE